MGQYAILQETLLMLNFHFNVFGWIIYYKFINHAMGGSHPFFCKTTPLKFSDVLIVGNQPILMEQVSRKF